MKILRPIIHLLTLVVGLSKLYANLGETPPECQERYGQPTSPGDKNRLGEVVYIFSKEPFCNIICIYGADGKCAEEELSALASSYKPYFFQKLCDIEGGSHKWNEVTLSDPSDDHKRYETDDGQVIAEIEVKHNEGRQFGDTYQGPFDTIEITFQTRGQWDVVEKWSASQQENQMAAFEPTGQKSPTKKDVAKLSTIQQPANQATIMPSSPQTPEQFIASFVTSSNSEAQLDRGTYYSFPVDYFEDGPRDHDYVIADIIKYDQKWPNRTYNLQPDDLTITKNEDGTYSAVCVIAFQIHRLHEAEKSSIKFDS